MPCGPNNQTGKIDDLHRIWIQGKKRIVICNNHFCHLEGIVIEDPHDVAKDTLQGDDC